MISTRRSRKQCSVHSKGTDLAGSARHEHHPVGCGGQPASIRIRPSRDINPRGCFRQFGLAGEMAIKSATGKLEVDFNRLFSRIAGVQELAVTWRHTMAVRELPSHHREHSTRCSSPRRSASRYGSLQATPSCAPRVIWSFWSDELSPSIESVNPACASAPWCSQPLPA